MKTPKLKRLSRAAALVVSGVVVFQFGLGTCVSLSNWFNPCQTVLTGATCQQQTLDFLNSDIPNFSYDPSCTIPGACGDLPFADFSGGLFGTGPGVRPP